MIICEGRTFAMNSSFCKVVFGIITITLAIATVAKLSQQQVIHSVKSNHSRGVRSEPIPKLLWFTFKEDILVTKRPRIYYDNVLKTIDSYRKAWDAPDAQARVLDDNECIQILDEINPLLTKAFQNEPVGAYKGDICRLGALYLYGGYYFDVDMEVVSPVMMPSGVSFSTVRDAGDGFFFNSFMAVSPNHPVLETYINVTIEYYGDTNFRFCREEDARRVLGPCLFYYSYQHTEKSKRGETFLLQETHAGNKTNGCGFNVDDTEEDITYFYSRIRGSHGCPISLPQKFWYTYKHDILVTKKPKVYYDNIIKTVHAYNFILGGDPDAAQIQVLDDEACKLILIEVDSFLSREFAHEENYQFRGDICRLGALYLYGGYYFDLDMEIVTPVTIRDGVEFVIAGNSQTLSNPFIAVEPFHPILETYIKIVRSYMKGERDELCSYVKENLVGGSCILWEAIAQTNEAKRGDYMYLEDRKKVEEFDGYMNEIIDPVEGTLYFNFKTNSTFIRSSIPHIFWFTYKHDILVTKKPKVYHDNIVKAINTYEKIWNTSDFQTRVLDDEACVDILVDTDPFIYRAYKQEENYQFRGDICRLGALYLYGGYYFDLDMEIVTPVTIRDGVEFVIAGNSQTLSNPFIAVEPFHPILETYIKIVRSYMKGERDELCSYVKENLVGGSCILWEAIAQTNEAKRGDYMYLEDRKKVEEFDGYMNEIIDPVEGTLYFNFKTNQDNEIE